MKIQLACKLHRPPQPSTLPSLGQLAFWLPRQHAAVGLPAAGFAGSTFHTQTVSHNAAAG